MNIYDDLTIIIVTYRSEKLILKNFEILKKLKVIIVDNSNSDHLENIIKNIDNIKYIKSPTNLGFGKAVNLAVKDSNTSLILILNPDIILDEYQLINLLNIFLADQNNIGILSPSLLDNNMKIRSNGSISYIEKLKGRKVSKSINNSIAGNTCYSFLMGSCFLMKRVFFNSLNGFDETFFMYFEDNDLCDRTIKAGKYIMETPHAKLIHLENSSTEKMKFTNTKLSIIHKISSYLYIKKNTNFFFLTYQILLNFFDYFQRFILNFLFFNFKKSYVNFLRLISIILFITSFYKIIYNYWRI